MTECEHHYNLEAKLDKLCGSIDEVNCNVVVLMGTIPTMATKEELYATKDEVSSVKAMALENKQTKNFTYWTVSAAISVITFLVGYSF